MTKSNLKEKEDYTIKSSDFLIKKITMKENKAIIEYCSDDDFKTHTGNFNVKDEVTEDFKNLWENAKNIIIELTPQLRKEFKDLRLKHIVFNYDSSGFLSDVSFSVIWTFSSNGHVLNLNYPKFPIYKPEMAENVVAISGKHEEYCTKSCKKLKTIWAESKEYCSKI